MAGKDEAPKDEKAPAGSKKKLYIIIGAAAAVVIVAVVAVLMLTGGKGNKKAPSAEAATEQKAEGEKKAEGGGGHGGGGGGEKGAAGAATVYPMEPFVVNIYDGQEIRYLKLKVEFEMANAAVKGELDGRQAPLRDAILVLLTTKTLQDISDLQGKNQLREEIMASTNKILPNGKITKVYFTDFVVQ